ncbi:MAG: nitroreductase family protein [Chloroflexota bacterium]
MDYAELAALVKERRSVRRYEDRDVPDEMIMRALELAVWAPNGGNHQSWAFYVVKDRHLITQMADAVRARTELIASWPEAEGFGDVVERWRSTSDFFRAAPVCIAVMMGNYASIADRILGSRGTGDAAAREMIEARETGSSRLQSVAAAINTLLLALQQEGLGTCWMAGPQQAKREIEELLAVPGDLDFVALVPVGFPAETPTARPRRPMDEVVRFLR